MARIAVLHAAFLGGGAESVCLWTLEALKGHHEVSLITLSEIDLPALNTYYGTHVTPSDVTVVIPQRGSGLLELLTSNTVTFTMRQHLLSRLFKPMAHRYAVCMSTLNEMDFGKRGIQYVYFPMFSSGDKSIRQLVHYPNSSIRRLLRRTTAALTGFSEAAAHRNLTLTCSRWSREVIDQLWPSNAEVIYPPVPSAYNSVPWADRQNSFVCVSRIVPEKALDRAIAILDDVRQRGFDVHLRIIGGSRAGNNAAYYRHIKALQADRQGWLYLDQDLTRDTVSRILSSYKFGLHVRENEQFGIGVAELLLAGCIPFVPERGGQAEIVGRDTRLTFRTREDAVDKIVAILSSPSLQHDILGSLALLRPLFSERLFMDRVREIVAAFVEVGSEERLPLAAR
jgi:glycosyltransferase involved in cell wall biosynthesis